MADFTNPFANFELPDFQKVLNAAIAPTPIGMAKGAYDAATAVRETPEVQEVLNQMAANNAAHPIYGGVGQNLGEDIIYDRVDALTGEERDSPNVVNIPLLPEGTIGTPTAEDLIPTDIQGQAVEAPPAVQEAVVAQQAATQGAQSKVVTEQAKTAMADSGATSEELGVMDRLSEEFDMMTLGMALLASNDGSGNVGSNIGKAMLAARQVKMNMNAAEAAAAAAGRKEGRAERETAVKEFNAETSRMAEERQRTAGVKPTATHNAIATGYLTDNPNFPLANEEMRSELAKVMAANLAEAEQMQLGLPPEQRMKQGDLLDFVAKHSMSQMNWKKQETMFGLGKDVYGI